MSYVLRTDPWMKQAHSDWGENYICGILITKIKKVNMDEVPDYNRSSSLARDTNKISTYYNYISTELDLSKDENIKQRNDKIQKNELSDSAIIPDITNRSPDTSRLLLNDKPRMGSLGNSIKAVFQECFLNSSFTCSALNLVLIFTRNIFLNSFQPFMRSSQNVLFSFLNSLHFIIDLFSVNTFRNSV